MRTGLGRGREVLLHVQLAQRLAHAAVDSVEHALPACALLGLAVEGLAVEGEVFVLERFGQVFGGVVDGVEGEIVAPLRGGYVGQHRVEAGEELRLRQREAVACRHVEGLEERGPVQKRSEEHTSELQSLMRNSYAVFCLKKKK